MRLVRVDPECVDVYSLQEFSDLAECGAVSPWDGNGYPAKYVDGVLMEDENHTCWNHPHGYTHITWYNK